MNIANVTARFMLLTGLDKSGAYEWRSVIDEAVEYVSSLVTKSNPDEDDMRRIETLCAVYAYRLCTLCRRGGVSAFTAGDVSMTLSADEGRKAEKLWNEYLRRYSGLVRTDDFLFGAVRI